MRGDQKNRGVASQVKVIQKHGNVTLRIQQEAEVIQSLINFQKGYCVSEEVQKIELNTYNSSRRLPSGGKELNLYGGLFKNTHPKFW